MRGCKSKECRFYDSLCEYLEYLKSPTERIDDAVSTPDPCTVCKRHYDDQFTHKKEGIKSKSSA